MNSYKKQEFLYKLVWVAILLMAFGLRVYNLQNIPNGLFTDEAARGYDAFSIAHTGADMFGVWLPIFLRGFDDYTAGLYVYLTVPLVYFLDLSRFSTRLASAFIGVLTVAVAYQAIRRPFGRLAGLVGAALIAISPWYVLLSRIGTEWNLLALGPMLTIVLAYRGLRRPGWLVAAGVVGGLSLYGYAPVKAFLPFLLLGFVLFYRRELLSQKTAALIAALILAVFAMPIYVFSFTASGLTRFQEIATFTHLSWLESAGLFIKNYSAYLNPKFLFITDTSQPNIFFIQRLKNVGLLYWFEFPLIIVGFFRLFKLGKRDHYFWLYWLLVAPIGINLHIHSPKPALWLTSTPTLHGLAGAGAVVLFFILRTGFVSSHRIKISVQRVLGGLILAGWGLLAIINVNTMLNDLFVQFPVYMTHTPDWGYGMKQGVEDLIKAQPLFDQANLDTFGGIAGIYLAYYTRSSPRQRHEEIAAYGENAWQRVGLATIGAIETRSLQPGCHVSLTVAGKRPNIPAPNIILTSYSLPDGQPGPLLLTAIASPQTDRIPVQVIFGDQILLAEYALASANSGDPLEMEPGQAICLVLLWQSAGNLTEDYTTFVHLIGPQNPAGDSPLWAQHDGVPVEGQRPTSSWQPGEIIQDMHVLFIPTDAPSGIYQLQAGLYNAFTGQRLSFQNDGEMQEQLSLIEISIR